MCKEYDVSQIAFSLHIVKITVIFLLFGWLLGIPGLLHHLWILVYSTLLEVAA